MAAQLPKELAAKWKEGTLCDLYVRKERKWNEGEVIGLFSDENGEWAKVRCGQEIHDVLCDGPYLRPRASANVLIPIDKMQNLQAAVIGTNADRVLQWILKTSGAQLNEQSNR